MIVSYDSSSEYSALWRFAPFWRALPPRKSQDPTPLGEFKDWAAYTYKTSGGKVCYVVSQPKASEPKNAKRDPIFFLVTHRPGQGVRNEVSTIIGYPFKKEAIVKVTVDKAAFDLFTNGDGAWADTSAKDKQIVAAMRKGQNLVGQGNVAARHGHHRHLFARGPDCGARRDRHGV